MRARIVAAGSTPLLTMQTTPNRIQNVAVYTMLRDTRTTSLANLSVEQVYSKLEHLCIDPWHFLELLFSTGSVGGLSLEYHPYHACADLFVLFQPLKWQLRSM